MSEKEKKPVSDWFTKKYGAYNMEWNDWYSSRTNVAKVREMKDWHTEQVEKHEKKTGRRNSDWLEEKHGNPAQDKADWFTQKHGGFRTEFPGWKSGMDPGNLDRIEQMYAKRFGNKKKTKTRDSVTSASVKDQTTKKESI